MDGIALALVYRPLVRNVHLVAHGHIILDSLAITVLDYLRVLS